MNTEPIIDLATFESLRETTGADFLGELIDAFCEETPQLIAVLQQALAQGDATALQRTAHSIKSGSANFGALPFSALARELEMIGRQGRLSEAAAPVDQLVVAYTQVERRLRELQHGT